MVEMINKVANKNVIYEGYINSEKINKYISDGYTIYYLPEQNKYNDEMFNMKCTKDFTKPFELE